MESLSPQQVFIIVAASLLVLGMLTFVTGVFVLTGRAVSKDLSTIAKQTTQLAQKGLAEEVSGLVGNASVLMQSVTELVRTNAGIGVFLTINGLALIGADFWLVMKLFDVLDLFTP